VVEKKMFDLFLSIPLGFPSFVSFVVELSLFTFLPWFSIKKGTLPSSSLYSPSPAFLIWSALN